MSESLSHEQREIAELIACERALAQDTPARQWWSAPATHPAVGRALGIDRTQEGGAFGIHPFRLMKVDDLNHVAAPWPCPRVFGPMDISWLDIQQVIAWNPVTNAVQIIGDTQAQIVGRFDSYFAKTGTGYLFGNVRTFFQSWAQSRAQWFIFAKAHLSKHVDRPQEPDLVPGCLAVGPLKDIRWNLARLPPRIECVGIDTCAVNAAILRSARLPRVTSMNAAA